MEELTRRDYRVIILYNFKRGLSADECGVEMSNIFSDDCPSRSTIYRWYKQFQRGQFQLEDDERSGRPSEAVTPENIAIVQKLINEDRHITYKQIEATIQIGAPAVHKILHDYLHVRKVCTLWVPHNLTDAQRECRVKWCHEMLKTFESGQSKQINSIVTGDETWLYYYDVPSKSRNKIWLMEDEEIPVTVKKSRSVKKKMLVVFFGKRGIIAQMTLEEQKTVTAKWYTEICLPMLIARLKTLRPKSRLSTWRLHHDNAPAHRAHLTTQFLKDSGLQILEHPPYSPDLAPCDFGLFPYVKEKLKGRRFSTDDELIQAWNDACADVPEEKWTEIFNTWFLRMEKCIQCDGKYFEKL